jgi:hypothetical protein
LTVFAGPVAEQRARDYFAALKAGGLKVGSRLRTAKD